jgi:cytoskeleton protein RodZ
METMAAGAEVRSLGQVLAAERERQGLACGEVAQRLHMSPWQVEALEKGDYARLPKGTFLRGFVRNYARLLHVDPNPILALLPAVARPESTAGASIEPPSEKIRFEPMGLHAKSYVKPVSVSLVVLGLGAAVMYWWLYLKDTSAVSEARKPAAAPAKPPAVAPQQVAQAPVPPAETPPPVEAPREEVRPEAAAAPQPARAAETKAEPVRATAAEGERRIALRFSAESWVEIRDARGRTLMSKLNTAGTAAEVSGRAPFTVIIGNAPGVQMTFDDRPYDLQPHSRVGVARVTVQ